MIWILILLIIIVIGLLFLILQELRVVRILLELPTWANNAYDERLNHVVKKLIDVANTLLTPDERTIESAPLIKKIKEILEERRSYFDSIK